MSKAGLHTGFLEEPVDLTLTDPVIVRTVEKSKPVHHTGLVRARIQEVEGKEMGLGSETQSRFQSYHRRKEATVTYASALFTLRT